MWLTAILSIDLSYSTVRLRQVIQNHLRAASVDTPLILLASHVLVLVLAESPSSNPMDPVSHTLHSKERVLDVRLGDHTLRLWDAQSGDLIHVLAGHTKAVYTVAYSPSGHQLASGSNDSTIRLWDAHTRGSGSILTGHTDVVTSVVYSPSGRQLASSADDKTVRLWDAFTAAPMSVLNGHVESVENVSFSPSGHQIASGSSDTTVRIWETGSGECSLILSGHTAPVWTVAYLSIGHRLASASKDGTVRIWDVISGGYLASLNDVDKPIKRLAWRECSADRYLATGNSEHTVRMWRVTEEGNKPSFSLQWSSPHGSLGAKDANLQSAHGLNKMQIQHLKQRGIVGEPISPLSMRAAGDKLITMASIVSRLNRVPKKEPLDDLAVGPSAGEAVLEVALKGNELAIEE